MYRSSRKEYRKRRRRSRFASTFALLVVIGGLGLVAYSLLGESSPLTKAVENATSDEEEAADSAPSESTLKLTIPDMERVSDVTVLDAPFDDESALEDGAQHVQDTGFPWEDEANVFIAGHRLGYLGTDSYLVFWDLDKLEDGDEVFLTDSEGTRYTYEVYENFVTDPYDWSVAEPVSGKNIVTLQTCTLPDYSERIIVQAELTEIEPGEGVEPVQEEETQEKGDPVPVELVPLVPGLDEPLLEEPLLDEPLLEEPLPEEPLPVEPEPVAPVQPAQPVPVGPAQQEPLPADPAPAAPAPIG